MGFHFQEKITTVLYRDSVDYVSGVLEGEANLHVNDDVMFVDRRGGRNVKMFKYVIRIESITQKNLSHSSFSLTLYLSLTLSADLASVVALTLSPNLTSLIYLG